MKLVEKNKELENQIKIRKELDEKINDYKFKNEISLLKYEELNNKLRLEKSEKIQLMEQLESYTMDEKKKDIIINNYTLDIEKLNNKLKSQIMLTEKEQQKKEMISENLQQLKIQINGRSQKYQEMVTQLANKTKEADHYLKKLREYEKEKLETAKKLNYLEELRQLHEKDIEELKIKTRQLNDTQKIAEEATLIASYKENEKNTLIESYNEDKKVHEEIIKDYEKKIAQKEKETSREIKALRNEIHLIKENNIVDKNNLTEEYENKIKRLNSEINNLEKENETLKNENLNLVMPKNQNQRIKYLKKVYYLYKFTLNLYHLMII